jgi:hypothetical protein
MSGNGVYRERPDPFSQSVQSLEMRVISARLCRTNCLLINRVTLPECLLEDRVSERRLIALSTVADVENRLSVLAKFSK